MCQASLLSSTANYQCQGVQRVALWPYHAVVCLQGQNIGELIFNSPKLGSEFPPISFSTCLMESKLPFPLPAAAMHSASSPPFHRGKSLSAGVLSYLEPVEVSWFEVIGWAATPVHNVLVLTLAAQLPVPVGDAQVVVHHGVAERAVLQHGVKEGLQQTGNRSPYLAPQTSIFSFTSAHGPKSNAGDLFSFEMTGLTSSIVLPHMEHTPWACIP